MSLKYTSKSKIFSLFLQEYVLNSYTELEICKTFHENLPSVAKIFDLGFADSENGTK